MRERRRRERQHTNQRLPIQALSSSRRRLTEAIDRTEDRLPPQAVDVVERLRTQDVLLYAASLAFYAVVSIVPFLLVGFWLTGLFMGTERIEELAADLTPFAPTELEVEELVRSLLHVPAKRWSHSPPTDEAA